MIRLISAFLNRFSRPHPNLNPVDSATEVTPCGLRLLDVDTAHEDDVDLPALDQELIDRFGTPELSPLYGSRSAKGTVTLTVRGRALFAAALQQHGLAASGVDAICDTESLRSVRLAVARARLAQTSAKAAKALERGTLPAGSRALLQSVLSDSPDQWSDALAQRERCERAGAKVLHVHFGSSAVRPRRAPQ